MQHEEIVLTNKMFRNGRIHKFDIQRPAAGSMNDSARTERTPGNGRGITAAETHAPANSYR